MTSVALVAALAVSLVRVIDGDTVELDGIPVRILEIDTAEIGRARCQRERMLGLAAKARLVKIMDGAVVRFQATGYDRYGRVLAHVYAGDRNVADILLAEGHAIVYRKGPEAKAMRAAHWCPFS